MEDNDLSFCPVIMTHDNIALPLGTIINVLSLVGAISLDDLISVANNVKTNYLTFHMSLFHTSRLGLIASGFLANQKPQRMAGTAGLCGAVSGNRQQLRVIVSLPATGSCRLPGGGGGGGPDVAPASCDMACPSSA